jgi:hypothetical protein
LILAQFASVKLLTLLRNRLDLMLTGNKF